MDALTVFADLTPETRARAALVTERFVWSFEALARHVAAMAGRFEARGVRAGDRVALVAAPSPEVFVAIHTLAAMGVTLVPIHPRLTPAEARVVTEVAAPHHVLEGSDVTLDEEGALPSIEAAMALGDVISRRAFEQGRSADRARDPAPGPSQGGSPGLARPAAPAPFAIVSTSGTTGRPKGAVLSRRAFLASAEASAQNLGWRDDDRWLLNMPLAHVGGLSVLTRCLVARRAVVLLPRFDVALFLEAIERHGVTLASVVPTMLRALLDAGQRAPLGRLRALLVGGAATPPSLLDECAAHGIAALTTYGLTEVCSQVTTQPPRDPSVRLAGSGPPLPGFELRIAGEGGAPLPPLHTGRIQIRGPALFEGYLQPDGSVSAPLTAEGFFDTGDIGELDDRGHLHVHARRTDLIVTGGENVYPVEVEQALERLPGVRRALVCGVPDERWGQVVAAVIEREGDRAAFEREGHAAVIEREGDRAAFEREGHAAVFEREGHAAVIEREGDVAGPPRGVGADVSLRELEVHVAGALAPHKRPRRWAFVDELPLTASGKVDRKDAAARYEALLTPGIRGGAGGAG